MSSVPNLNPLIRPAGHGIFVIDTGYGRPGYDAAYLVCSDDGRGTYIDTGVNASLPALLAALEVAGLAREAVDWVLLTHIHLDHAGAAGALLQALPVARLGVHPRGVRHMADPGPLMEAVRAVYGPEMAEREYGTLVPVPAERIVALDDGASVTFGTRTLQVIDSPGHARHHVCFWDADSHSWFTGDAFGLFLPELRTAQGHCVVPTTSPSQFEPDPFHITVERLMARAPRAMFPTHSGEVLHPERHAPVLLGLIDAQVEAARTVGQGPEGAQALRGALLDLYLASLHRQGWSGDRATLETILGVDLMLNADGMKIWVDRPAN